MSGKPGKAGNTAAVREPSLEQLRVLVAAADDGSFSAAARRLGRAQSAVSQAMAALEAELGVVLWDRTTRVPVLTPDGRAMLAAARRVLLETEALRQLAQGLVAGQEPVLAVVVDAVFPESVLVRLSAELAQKAPSVQLRIRTELLTAVAALVSNGAFQFGVIGPHADARGLSREFLMDVEMVPVAAKPHPLASRRGRIPAAEIARHIQIVLSERGYETSRDRGVLAHQTYRVSDMATKAAMIRAGVGWGNLPDHAVVDDLASGRLTRLQPDEWGRDENRLSLSLARRSDVPLGPVAQWVRGRLRELCAEAAPAAGRGRRSRPRR